MINQEELPAAEVDEMLRKPGESLVDTSDWIEVFLKARPLDLARYVAFNDIVTCLPVIEEVLQGFGDESAYRAAREAMFALPVVESPMPASLFEDAARLYRTARRQGSTVRSSVDCRPVLIGGSRGVRES